MPVSKARKKAKKHNGQRTHKGGAGRFALAAPTSQTLALRLMARVLLGTCIVVLASSTVSDPLQALARQGQAESVRLYGPQDFSNIREQERVALLRRIAGNADAVRGLSQDELTLVFGEPSLRRQEAQSVSWHFTSGECALDVYFPRRTADGRLRNPVYAEYRVRTHARETGLSAEGQHLNHLSCVRSLYAHARAKMPDKDGRDAAPVSAAAADGRG